jgi:uroporphyrinogen decarboxylase
MLNSFRLKEVDKLPHGDQMIHDELVAALLHEPLEGDGRNALAKWMKEVLPDANFKRHLRARKVLGFDWVHLFPIEPFVASEKRADGVDLHRDIWGQKIQVTDRSFEIIEPAIQSLEGLDSYAFPSPSDFIFSDITRWSKESDLWVTVQIDTGFFKVSQLVGFENYMMYLADDPGRMTAFMERFTEFQKGLVDRILEAGADSVWFSNDHAFNAGPFMSPAMLWDYDFQYLAELVDYVHSKGRIANYHSCGNIAQTLPLLIKAGIDSLHAIQPSAGNDLVAYHREYGKDLCFVGNFDMDHLMPKGSPEEIDQAVGAMIEKLWKAKRTGYVVATCNMLNNDQPLENAMMLHYAAEKHGR